MAQKKATHPLPKTRKEKEKQGEQRFTLTFDEFFKIGMKAFFSEFGYDVQSEVELFKLPKKLDVLLLQKNEEETPNNDFELLNYFTKYNLVSFKSPKDPIKSKDITDAIIYLNGFMNMTKEANYNNITMSIFCNSKPRNFLKENKEHVIIENSGHWVVNYGLFVIHIINLSETPFRTAEAFFLKEFTTRKALQKVILEKNIFPNLGDYYKQKVVDIVKRLMYIRIKNFETNPLEGIKMPTTWTADITDIVKPHYEQGLERGLEQGIERGIEQGLERGRSEGIELGLTRGSHQKAIETAKRLKKLNVETKIICESTGLSEQEVAEL